MTAGLAFAQGQRVQIDEVERLTFVDNRITEVLDRLSQLRLGKLSDPAAQAMLAASAKGSTTFLRWKLGDPSGATTSGAPVPRKESPHTRVVPSAPEVGVSASI
jgi:hypothetical protein